MRIAMELNNPQPAGDVRYPIRLLADGDGLSLRAERRFWREAAAFCDGWQDGQDPGRVLLDLLAPRMTAEGYAPLPRAAVPTVIWRGTRCAVPELAEVMRLAGLPACGWALTHARSALMRGHDAWVVMADHAVVAAAWLCGGAIAVETAPAYRRRGYARAVVAALTSACLVEGREVRYCCAETNAASMALAASLGFVPAAREYRPGFRRKST